MIEAPFEMANLFPKHTGLPFVVWISYRGGARHDVRVKVSRNAKAMPSEMMQYQYNTSGKSLFAAVAKALHWVEFELRDAGTAFRPDDNDILKVSVMGIEWQHHLVRVGRVRQWAAEQK